MKIREIIAPAHWANALVNGDQSGLTTDEVIEMNAWIKSELDPNESIVGTNGEEFYSSHTIMGPNKWFAGTVIEYQTLKVEPSRYDDLTAKREGWALFLIDDGKVMIQRLDDPQACGSDFPVEPIFETDDAAITFVTQRAKQGSAMHQDALRQHGNEQ